MPETIAPPAPPAAPAPEAAPLAPPTPEIHVTAAAVDTGPKVPPPKKGSAREAMFDALRKKVGAESAPEPVTGKAEAETPEEKTKEAAETPPPEEGNKPDPKTAQTPGKRQSPWKLLEEHKAARLKAESELVELRKQVPDVAALKAQQEKFSALEKHAKELEDEIRFLNFQKHPEFVEKYEKPYEDAWKRWMNDLGELTVVDESNNERPLSPQDLLRLVSMPLQQARKEAEEVFGSFADDVMNARKEIKSLFESKQAALDQARKNGEEREAARQKEAREQHDSLSREIQEVWSSSNAAALSNEKVSHLFKPIEGDEEGNKRLTSGFEMADRAFALSPLDPRLTKEQRAEIVKLHSAVRNRAAAFGRLVYQKQKLESQIKELTEELNKYREVEPGKGEGRREPEPAAPTGGMAGIFAELRKRAS